MTDDPGLVRTDEDRGRAGATSPVANGATPAHPRHPLAPGRGGRAGPPVPADLDLAGLQDHGLLEWSVPPPSPVRRVAAGPSLPASTPQPVAPRGSSSSRTHHSSSSQRKLRRLRRLAWLLLAGNVLALILGIIGFGQWQRLRTEGNRLASQVRQLESELTRARDRVTELSSDMRVLLANRIPGIAQLGFGRTLEVNQGYIRSVSFGRAGPEQPITYSLVVQNSGAEPVVPRARILLFDEVGLQTGSAEVGSPDTAAGAPVQALAPGEARTLKGQIESFRSAPPAYFLVQSH